MLASSMNLFAEMASHAKTPDSALSQKNEALFDAIELMDLKAIKEALANGADVVNALSKYGDSPLVCAERRGHTEAIALLLDHGAKIDDVTEAFRAGEKVLHKAVIHKHREIVTLLLARGADVNATDHGGRTALQLAASFDHREMAELLLAHGADANAKNKFGETVLYDAIQGIAIYGGSVKIVELLLNHGVDVNGLVHDDKKLTPLLWAVQCREKEIVKLLLKRGADRNAVDSNGMTAFKSASSMFDMEIAQLLAQVFIKES